MRSELNLEELLKIDEIFIKQGWVVDRNRSNTTSRYNRYCERLKLLNKKEQDIVFALTEEFLHIPFDSYLEEFLMSYYSLPAELFEKYDNIYIAPLIEPYVHFKEGVDRISRGKTKSANFLYYFLNDISDISWIDHFDKIEFIEDIDRLKRRADPSNSALVLIDDFVGTGQTAGKICKTYLDEEFNGQKLNADQIFVLTIISQYEGENFLSDKLQIRVTADKKRSKGLSDKYENDELRNLKEVMVNLEQRLCNKKIFDQFSLGHGQSEALVSFANKTPNNTFPVFWFETESKLAPFPRYNIYKHGNKTITVTKDN